jgi:CO dehydrogenase maturation factor
LSAEQLLSSVPSEDTIIVADLEAGIGTLTRLPDQAVDVTIVVVEPTPRSIDVAQRAVLVASERAQGRVMIVANKVADDEDEARIRAAFSDAEIVIVPVDPVVNDADRLGVSPVDVDAGSPANLAISEMSEQLHP